MKKRKGNCSLGAASRITTVMKTHLDSQEVEPTLISQGLGYHGLGAARGPVQQDSSRRLDPHAGEGLGVPQGPLHGLLQFQLHLVHPAHIRPADLEGRSGVKSGCSEGGFCRLFYLRCRFGRWNDPPSLPKTNQDLTKLCD